MSAAFDSTVPESQASMTPFVADMQLDTTVFASIDFAHLAGDRLLVYGWILGFANQVEEAVIYVGDTAIDLSARARRVRRSDVSQHFSVAAGNDEHGFFTLVDSLDKIDDRDDLRLSVTLKTGETHDSRWMIQRHELVLSSIPQSDLTTVRTLLRASTGLDRLRLSRFLSYGSEVEEEPALPTELPFPIRFEVDLTCVVEGSILIIYGWLLDPTDELEAVQLAVGNSAFDLQKDSIAVSRADINYDVTPVRQRASSRPPGFVLVQEISKLHATAGEAIFALTAKNANTAVLTRTISWDAEHSRQELMLLLNKMDNESSMSLIERILAITKRSPHLQSLGSLLKLMHSRSVDRLPVSIHHIGPLAGYSLHVDQTIQVADRGIFMGGWFYTGANENMEVLCHCGDSSYSLNRNWIRCRRRDVTSHLDSLGLHSDDHEHGFTCYVPIRSDDQPYWISVQLESGDLRRMRIPTADSQPTLQTVRRLLGTFTGEHREIKSLLDTQIGPAVKAVWRARPKLQLRETNLHFGERPHKPIVSVIVPLYGRWDFVEYQMALFANDKSFLHVDLIYVVDDPAIYDELRQAAPNLFGVYGIPFSIVFCGANLGFAGANNFGVRYARSTMLLLLNSDVLPKQAGWIGKMLETYKNLPRPGLLGVKLIYEDSTLQHAGMEFRRHEPWGGMWINDHPSKGQSASELKGVHKVSAVTAACVLMKTELYRKLGGFSEDYIIGDFEDSDLCLRARAAGYRNYVTLDVELYHLERQSQNTPSDPTWRSNLTAYNCWLHHQRWSRVIEQIAPESFNRQLSEGRTGGSA